MAANTAAAIPQQKGLWSPRTRTTGAESAGRAKEMYLEL